MNLRAMIATDPDQPKRMRGCGVNPVGQRVEVRTLDGTSYYSGLETCANARGCPVCGAKIGYRRSQELRAGLTKWQEAGYSATLVTFTVPHDLADALTKLMAAEGDGWSRMTAGSPYKRLKERLGIEGFTKSEEVTWGDEHGWHPHFHVMFWHLFEWQAEHIAAFYAHAMRYWSAACEAAGLRVPDAVHAIDIRANVTGDAVAGYISKLQENWTAAEEMTRGDLKTGRAKNRVPFQILADYYATGDCRDRDLWFEYLKAVKGKSVLYWSRGLRKKVFGEDAEPEAKDAELAEAEVGGELVAVVPLQVWHRIRQSGLDHAVLVAAERDGLAGINALLHPAGCGRVLPPDEGS